MSRFETYSTSEAIVAGLDLEMPGLTRWRGIALNHAVASNKIYTTVVLTSLQRVNGNIPTIFLAYISGDNE
jgi:hypothetical protein